MASNKIKIIAPATNPHICYVSKEFDDKIKYIKNRTKKSLYAIICASAGTPLNTKERIHEFKQRLKDLGWRNIGDWVENMITVMCASDHPEDIPKPTRRDFRK